MVCRVESQDGFSGEVDLACESPYENLPCNFIPPSVTVPRGGSASSLYNNPPTSLPPGRYEMRAVATSNGVTVTAPVVLEVAVPEEYAGVRCPNQFKLDRADIVDVPAGEQGVMRCTVASSYGTEISVILQCPAVAGIICTAPNPVIVPAYSTVEVDMTVDVPLGTPADGYRFYITHDKRMLENVIPTWFLIEVVAPSA